ncbi:MAG: GNAT family N-acetyltransferase [Bacteroidales bacterium]|nr:GNAT family N-acetyltransferase [Bacteroidales bacterium]
MKTIKVETTYFEMFEDPKLGLPSNDNNISIEKHVPTVDDYRKLFIAVGKNWLWSSRLVMTKEELEKIITDNNVEIYLLKIDGTTAGFIELDRSFENDIELAFLGLIPDFIGKGFGKYCLHWAIQKSWFYNPKRLWLHTCKLDHPNAMELYKKVGFKVYKVSMIEEYILNESDY